MEKKSKNKSKKKKFVIKTSFFKELKAFLLRGNVVDLAVAVIIGAAFGKITSSLVADILMPPIALLIGGEHFAELAWVIKPATDTAQAVTINFGSFLQTILEFLIIGVSIFIIVKIVKRITSIKFQTKQEAIAAAKKLEEKAAAEKAEKERAEAEKKEREQAAQDAVKATIRTEELLAEILEQLKKPSNI